ncbi:hypothetical protein DACRYDRAFT_107822 [Dacryopinax primogenitus]|uniref:Uncharacterized protein n=1 Tax=Dacryopinax primogenitus (strain DJM 731) TaxID=1858805 RepID=M5FZG5_DACPD|nr:uncharacterized protein DACRYDRAFT_107822 [Dacryopinax primogenitus]EJU01265.1 hypothetical protein DACRYDRAFT_107822 [Dacryopinax primogenitus]
MRVLRRRLVLLLSLPLTLTLLFLLYLHRLQLPPQNAHFRRPSPTPSELLSLRNSSSKYALFHQLRGAGFNNQLQESLLLSWIAKRAGRAYVYRDVIWRPRGYEQVPLEEFVQSLTEQPALHEEAFKRLCDGQKILRAIDGRYPFPERVERVIQDLQGDEQCAYVEGRIMDWPFLDSPAALALYEPFLSYIRDFRWSPWVLEVHARAVGKLGLGEGYIALHIRRGDFSYHCPQIAAQGASFNLWSRLPFLPDTPPHPLSPSTILTHCWPSFGDMLLQIWAAQNQYEQRTGKKLRKVYVLHDAKWDAPWVWILLRRLQFSLSGGPFRLQWVEGGSLPLTWEERDLAVPVDMEIARRAEVFLGNGFSSLTSGVVLFRLADGKEWESNKFW